MRLSQKTLQILRILSSVNRYIVLNENSNFIRVINNEMTLFAETKTEETFPHTLVIDATKFFGLLPFFVKDEEESLDVEFSTTKIVFKLGNRQASVVALDPKMISYFPFVKKDISIPEMREAAFLMTKSHLREIKQASSVLGLDHLAIRYSENGVIISLEDPKKDYFNNPTSDVYTLEVGGESFGEGICYLKLQYLSMIYPKGEYGVTIYSVGGKYKILFDLKDSEINLRYYLAGVVQ